MFTCRYYEYLCQFATGNSVPCEEENLHDQHGICIFPEEVCDGIPHCPNATDETLDKCGKYFSHAAQMECDRPNIKNELKVSTLAIRCNGISECADGEDEANCQFSQIILYAALLPGLVSLFTISYYVLSRTNITEAVHLDHLPTEECESQARYQMLKCQLKSNRGQTNRKYFQETMNKHGGQYYKALNDMKVCKLFQGFKFLR